MQFLKQNCANWCKVHGATTAAFHARNSTSGKGFHDTSTASAIKMCCNDKFSRKLYMHKNKGCSRSQHDWTAKIMQKEERNCTKDLMWWHTAVICAAQRWHKKKQGKNRGVKSHIQGCRMARILCAKLAGSPTETCSKNSRAATLSSNAPMQGRTYKSLISTSTYSADTDWPVTVRCLEIDWTRCRNRDSYHRKAQPI